MDGNDQGRALNLSSASPHNAAFQPLASLFVASVNQYVVSVSQGVGTTLSPSTNQTVDDGSTVAFSGIAIANATYFETLVFNTTCGNSSSYSSGAGTYTTAAISANCTVSTSASLKDTDGDTVPDICADASATATYSIDCSQYTSLIPVAADDSASTNEDTSVDIAVLSNDTYVDAGDLAVNLGSASNGTVSLVGNTVRFTPTANYSGTGSFTYTVTASARTSATATVTIAVTSVNDGPTADAGSDQTVASGATFSLSGSGSDPDGDTLTYTWSQTAGTSVASFSTNQASPSVTAPTLSSGDSAAILTFSLSVSDGAASDSDTVDVTVNPPAPTNTWTATINITGITGQGNGKFSVSVPGCSPSSKGNNTAAFSCTATISDASWSPSVTINPSQSYCTSDSSKSSSDYTPSVTLSAASPAVSISVTFVNNKTNNCSAPVTYP